MAPYPTHAEIRGMSKEDLIRAYDSQPERPHAAMRLEFYLGEIARRDLEEQSQKMLTLTEEMRNMTADIRAWTRAVMWFTLFMTVLTVINVVLILPWFRSN